VMASFTEFFVIFLILTILVWYAWKTVDSEVEFVRSTVDNRRYLVKSMPDKQDAADMLASINQDIVRLIKHLRIKYPDWEVTQMLYKNYDPDAISEGSPDSGYTSYAVNKGEKLVICIRNTDMSFVEKNVVLYPAIHEVTHIGTHEIGHTPLFWSNFKVILQEAIDIGVYTKVDFKNNPTDYCSIKITSSVV
jgi:hypothetical protein